MAEIELQPHASCPKCATELVSMHFTARRTHMGEDDASGIFTYCPKVLSHALGGEYLRAMRKMRQQLKRRGR